MSAASSIPESTITSLSNFLDLVAQSYSSIDAALFRGQRRADWSLTPRIDRIVWRANNFRGVQDVVASSERRMLDEFQRLAVPHLGFRQGLSSWDWLALAQHHGLPTRLLDWSSNPLVGLWFAVQSPAEHDIDGVVWGFDAQKSDYVAPDAVDPFSLEKTLIFRPRHHDARIVAQSGWFTVHKLMTKNGTSYFSPLEKVAAQKIHLRKFIVPNDLFPTLRLELARCGITQASLFPDLAGLCAHLSWQFAAPNDEIDLDLKINFG